MRALMLLAAGLLATFGAAPIQAAMLKPAATLDAEFVRVTDLFDDVGPSGDAVVMRAPQPGRRFVLDAAWLAEAARTHGVDWRPTSRYDRIVVERIGRVISRADLIAAVREALVRDGASEGLHIELAGRVGDLAISLQAPPTIDIQSLAFDRVSGRFSALALAGAGHASAQRLPLAGRATVTRQIPVLRRPVQAGDVIRRDDVDIVDMREEILVADSLVDANRVIGQSARRALRSGVALREGDVRAPLLVPRNGLVTIVLRVGTMTLTAQGRALDEGARGETIRVLNVQTKKTIEAEVAGPDLVSVTVGNRVALAN